MSPKVSRQILYQVHPHLVSRRLGSDLYAPGEALVQLVANSLDADCSTVNVDIVVNELGGPCEVVISDDGRGIPPHLLDQAFATLGSHVQPRQSERETIGSKGVGRFAVFALAPVSLWETVADDVDGFRVRQTWEMDEDQSSMLVECSAASAAPLGTRITLRLKQTDSIRRLFGSVLLVKRTLFNAFAAYLLRYRGEVVLNVNSDIVDVADYVESEEVEQIEDSEVRPGAVLRHLVLGAHVEQPYSCALVFASHGTTISSRPIDTEPLPSRRYLGLVDSPYFDELANTAKSDLADMDSRFETLAEEVLVRARRYISHLREARGQSFIEVARTRPYYPFRCPPTSPIDTARQIVYDTLLVALNQEASIERMTHPQQRLLFKLTERLLQSEDLASVLTEVLGLAGEDVTRFAALLKNTSLASVISVSELLVDRFRFLDELQELVYGPTAVHVLERKQLHKILERHTWLFGEQYNLMGSDASIGRLIEDVVRKTRTDAGDEEENDRIDVVEPLRDIPDLWLHVSRWNESAKFSQHLIVELKRPSVRITSRHVDQVERYARQIVRHPLFGQKGNSHRFTFVAVSSEVGDLVRETKYQDLEEPGFISRPANLGHPTEIWALRWSDFIDQRRQELDSLRHTMEINTDPSALDYLKKTVGRYLPDKVMAVE